LSSFVGYLKKLFESDLPTDEKINILTERYGGTRQYIPTKSINEDEIYNHFKELSPTRGMKQEAYQILSKVYGVSVRRIREVIRKWEEKSPR